MSDTENELGGSTGISIPRFHGRRGEDYALWRHRLRAICRIKGVWNVVNTGMAPSESTQSTNDGDPRVSAEAPKINARVLAKREMASGIIISALGNAPLRVVIDIDDDPARMMQLLDARYASNRTVSRIAVQTQLFRMSYTDQDMSTYIDQYTSLFSQLERMGKDVAIPEVQKAPMLLASIDPNCPLESTAAALRTKDVTELTWEFVATTLIDEYNARKSHGLGFGKAGRSRSRHNHKTKPSSTPSQQGDSAKGVNDDSDDTSDTEGLVRAFAAAVRSTKRDHSKPSHNLHCDFCDKSGHTEDRCYFNPSNPNNRLTQKLRNMLTQSATGTANVAVCAENNKNCPGKARKIEFAGTMIEKTTIVPPKDQGTYADSGATVHCFYSESSFVPESIVECETRTVMLADNTSIKASFCGDVILPFDHADIRLKRALYIPNLGYNLVSTGRLADNGIESHFRRHDVRLMLELDRSFIGAGQRNLDSGMYMLPEPELQNLEEPGHFPTLHPGLHAGNIDVSEDVVADCIEQDSDGTGASFELHAESRYSHRERRKPQKLNMATPAQSLSTPPPTKRSGVDFDSGTVPRVTSRALSWWRRARSASSQ